jgi:hypothetical protein
MKTPDGFWTWVYRQGKHLAWQGLVCAGGYVLVAMNKLTRYPDDGT